MNEPPKTEEATQGAGVANSPPSEGAAAPGVNSQGQSTDLTPEEQMALYEKELKENDWGHQPC